MKKNIALRIAAVSFLLVLISACFLSELMVGNAGLEHGFFPSFLLIGFSQFPFPGVGYGL